MSLSTAIDILLAARPILYVAYWIETVAYVFPLVGLVICYSYRLPRVQVVVATNIAETSVTVPGVRFVIDPGYVKQKTYDPARRMESLVIVPISQVAAQQRAGRAGRTAAGQCYRLYSRDCFAAMLGETIPEILRTNLANTLLYLKVSCNGIAHVR